jgi:hypothetical protein
MQVVNNSEWCESMDFEDLRVDCLSVLYQHCHGENKEKYSKPQSGYLMTHPYRQEVMVTMHLSVASVRLYSVCIAPCPYNHQWHGV